MTTIVVNRKEGYIAADRLATSNDCEVATRYPKIRTVTLSDGVHLLASSGMESSAQIFEEWYESESSHMLIPLESMEDMDKFTTVILTPKNKVFVADHFYRPYRIYAPIYGTGTGAPFAWAVLEATGDIDLAMKTAIKMDPNSGFGYDIVRLSDYN
jgi:hypothetical protein